MSKRSNWPESVAPGSMLNWRGSSTTRPVRARTVSASSRWNRRAGGSTQTAQSNTATFLVDRKVNLTVEGAAVEAVRCDIRTYYAVLATITYDSGDVVYVSALTKLASISDVVNLVESVSLS